MQTDQLFIVFESFCCVDVDIHGKFGMRYVLKIRRFVDSETTRKWKVVAQPTSTITLTDVEDALIWQYSNLVQYSTMSLYHLEGVEPVHAYTNNAEIAYTSRVPIFSVASYYQRAGS